MVVSSEEEAAEALLDVWSRCVQVVAADVTVTLSVEDSPLRFVHGRRSKTESGARVHTYTSVRSRMCAACASVETPSLPK